MLRRIAAAPHFSSTISNSPRGARRNTLHRRHPPRLYFR
jgi:hypothetical protein